MSNISDIKKGQRFLSLLAGTVYEVVRVMPKSGKVTLARIGRDGGTLWNAHGVGVTRNNWPVEHMKLLVPYKEKAAQETEESINFEHSPEDEVAGLEPGTLATDRKLARQGLTVVRFSSGESFARNSRGRCEDAPCCGCCTI